MVSKLHNIVVISRSFTTEDSNDRPILLTGLKTTSLLLASGSSDTLSTILTTADD